MATFEQLKKLESDVKQAVVALNCAMDKAAGAQMKVELHIDEVHFVKHIFPTIIVSVDCSIKPSHVEV